MEEYRIMKRQEVEQSLVKKEIQVPVVPFCLGIRKASCLGLCPKGKKLGKLERKEVERHERIRLNLCHFTMAGRVFSVP